MSPLIRRHVAYCLLLGGLLLASCSPGATVQNPEVTFDGEICTYQGPEVVREGSVVFVFNNASDNPGAHLHVAAVPDVGNWPLILEASAEGSLTASTGGMRELSGRGVEGNPDAKEYDLESGAFAVLCVIHGVNGWPAVLLEVKS